MKLLEIALRRLNTFDADKLIENVSDDDRNADLDGILMMKMTAGWQENTYPSGSHSLIQ